MSLRDVIEKAEQAKYGKADKQTQERLDGIMTGDSPSFSVSGTRNERAGRIDGLERAKILTGQNPYEIGQEYQNAFNNIKKRTEMSDTASELLRANKAGAVADARNQMQSQGVKGGAALGAVSQVERAKAYDVNNLLAENQRKAETDYMNAAKGNANFTLASEMGFGSLAATKDMKSPGSNSGGMGTVICTELYRQGYYTYEIYQADQFYGDRMMTDKPHVYWGYRLWADHVVSGMKKSKAFTKFVALLAVPWAMNMAGKRNVLGAAISFIGEPICGILGKLFWRNNHAIN